MKKTSSRWVKRLSGKFYVLVFEQLSNAELSIVQTEPLGR